MFDNLYNNIQIFFKFFSDFALVDFFDCYFIAFIIETYNFIYLDKTVIKVTIMKNYKYTYFLIY